MKKCLLGVVSWCDSGLYPERFKIFKKCVRLIEKYINPGDFLTAIVDNNSTEDVKSYIESSSVFDKKILLPENIHDVGAYGVLSKIATDQGLPYIWILENDYILYKSAPIIKAIQFLRKHPECGYLRLQKFEVSKQYKYDKLSKSSSKDRENTVWLKNIVTNKALEWSKPFSLDSDTQFYINNWHFGLHGGLVSTYVWNKLYPALTKEVPYYYKLESLMRAKFASLDYKTAVLDGGVFSMEASSVYQPKARLPFLSTITQTIQGTKGGYVSGEIISYYFKNYQNFAPVQIQLFSNSLGVEELNSLKEVFASRWLGYGPKSKEFETQFSLLIGAKYVLGISSCTAGLFMSMEILNIGPGDEVIIPSVGFIGCANAVLKAGATPIFVDVDKEYFNILPKSVEKAITSRTKAIIVLHYGGIPCDISAINAIIRRQKRKIYMIEDSANSIKSLYKGKYCGTIGDIGLFSLDANKVITTGTGGIFTTNNDEIYQKAKIMRFYGLRPETSSGYDALRARRERWWEIDLLYHGNRYLINDITSALALSQLKKLDTFILKRKRIWSYYQKNLKKLPGITIPKEPPKVSTSSYYFYWIQVQNEEKQLSLARALVRNGIYTTFRYYPLHLIDYYKSKQKLENSEEIAKKTLNLPFHHNLNLTDLHRITATIENWVKVSH